MGPSIGEERGDARSKKGWVCFVGVLGVLFAGSALVEKKAKYKETCVVDKTCKTRQLN